MPGSGLGLAIVAQAIREAGGEVSLGPAEGATAGAGDGAVATIRLPGAPAAPAGPAGPAARPDRPAQPDRR